MALEVSSNVMAQFAPITPTEHFLAQQLIHQQLRFLQMQFLYDAAFAKDAYALLTDPSPGLSIIMRELDRLPARIQRTIKALHAELALRVANEELEIEPIADLPTLPKSSRPAPPEDNDPENRHYTQEQGKIAAKMLFSLFARRVLGVNPETGAKLTPQPNAETQSPDPKAA